MSSVQEIEKAISQLTLEEMKQVREWLENVLEDQLEFTAEFRAEIETAKASLAQGVRGRVRNPV